MKKWIVIVAIILIVAATALAIWRPWKASEPKDLPLVQEEQEYIFTAMVVEISGDHVLVAPLEGEDERRSSDLISFSSKGLNGLEIDVGSVLSLTYNGMIRESYPAQIDVDRWELEEIRAPFPVQWLDKETAEKYDNNIFDHIVITAIYEDCFLARPVIPMPYVIKLNGIPDGGSWCVGDQVVVTYENTYYDQEKQRVEVDLLTIEPSDWEPNEFVYYKPVIYLYPQEETKASVFLELDGQLTCTYPAYKEGWTVTAQPDGTLTDAKGQTYNYLYWEGETNAEYDLSQGFCVKGADSAAFLESALAQLGLNRKEANEFIVYWLPQLEANAYNVICFQGTAYTDAARLTVLPQPDTTIRVFMTFYGTDTPVDIPPQELTAPSRTGFTVVEWGGTEIKN